MRVVTVVDTMCWACEEITTCLRFIGRSGHRRMDICMWCVSGALELITGFGIVRAMGQWMAMRNMSVEIHGPNHAKFTSRIPRRFRHQ